MQALYAQIGIGISKYFKLYKCVKHIMQDNAWIFLIDLFKYCPRKFGPFVLSPNWTWTILGLPKIWTPIYTSTHYRSAQRSNTPLTELQGQTFESLTLAGTGGLMQPPPLRFFWNIFFVYRSNVTIFSLAFRPSFLRPP